ncbi:MAG: hypothetical protein ACKOX6_00960 [Bdellovibrio sp.]
MFCVILESPFRAHNDSEQKLNIAYAWKCVADCLKKNEAAFASHLFYPNVLDDNIEAQREGGISAGWDWMTKAEYVVCYVDRGISEGMIAGLHNAQHLGKRIEFRKLPGYRHT